MGSFQKRLLIAFTALALISVVQGAMGIWAINLAVHNVQRGRVASDLLAEFLELSANKQRLKTWLSQALISDYPDNKARLQLQKSMSLELQKLAALAKKARELDGDNALAFEEHSNRQDALTTLTRGIETLNTSLSDIFPIPEGTDPATAWKSISKKFDVAEGRDLRTLLTESIERERIALARDRAVADTSLQLLIRIGLGATLTLALASILLAVYFTRALRRPLEDLSKGALALQSGDLLHRIPDARRDEFSRLAHSVNNMAGELYSHRLREAQARQQLEQLVQARTNELELAVEKLEKLDLRRRQLFADISHELRTPTTAIRGEAEITLRGRDKPLEEYKVALTRIVSASQQLGLVIDDLLTMARSDIDMLALERVNLDVNLPLTEAISHVQMLANAKTIQIDTLLTSEVVVLGDSQRLRQLFTLILENAVNYSHPNQTIQVKSDVVDMPNQAPQWCLSISDAGIGIAPDELLHIFERNYRSASARKLRPEGSGLGLPLAGALVRAHGGHIEVKSQTNIGTEVYIWLPITNHQLSITSERVVN